MLKLMKKFYIPLFIFLIVALVVYRYKSFKSQEETIKIGAIFMLSGAGSNWGENSQKGAELALEDINKCSEEIIRKTNFNGRVREI